MSEAGLDPRGAIDVDNQPAGAADAVMVVVVRPRLVQRRAAVEHDPPQQPRLGQVREAIVHRLMRHPRQHRRHRSEHRRRAGVGTRIDRVEDGDALARDAESGIAN